MNEFDNYYELGNVVRTHGLKGELMLLLDVDDPTKYKKLESIFLEINGKLVPFFIQEIQIRNEMATVQFEDINSIQVASDLIGKRTFLPITALPKLEKGQYYYHDLIGFQVFDGKTPIGKVKEIITSSSNTLISTDHKGKEVLIPMDPQILLSVDLEKSEVHTQLPDGLLAVYLDS